MRITERAEIAILLVGLVVATAALAITGCAEETGREPEQLAATRSAPHAKAPKSPTVKQPADVRASRLQKRRDWWNDAREVLFEEIELTAEQARGVDAIIDEQLDKRAQMQQSDGELQKAHKSRDPERTDLARRAVAAILAQLKQPHEIYDEMRALVTEDQRPRFDMNRARQVNASRTPPKGKTTQTGKMDRADSKPNSKANSKPD